MKVSEAALVKRINRKLKAEDQALKKSRPFYDGERPFFDQNFGKWYVLDWKRNRLIQSNVDIEKLGRDLGVLGPSESLKKEGA